MLIEGWASIELQDVVICYYFSYINTTTDPSFINNIQDKFSV